MRMLYAEGLTSPEVEIAEGGTMLDNKSRYADLKIMLDSNRENIKMDAMKRIINMVARGKDVSELFPAVVKNVAVKNLELKKLVYVYLVRYAEEQQDLALLSISTFQRALKDPNQLIRASALRVLSSIRVGMIAPVMLLAIKESVRDMSAYVRKVAAHAIPKLYALDPDLQPQLLECIDFLLADKRTLVLGSAVHAFEETCPDRFDLLHRHFRALCRALADVDEWGQIVMIGLLTRYARTQFVSPLGIADGTTNPPLDPDHSLLIVSAKPLLQSRNCAVVMAVAQLLYYIAPHSQLAIVPRSLVRLLRGPNEVQYVILVNIATICAARNDMVNEQIFAISKNLFEPFLKSFFVRGSDTTHVKQLKLQVLTSLVSETNVQLVIRELQAYLQMADLASAAIEAIGRCALQVPSAAESCLTCLINLISSNKEQIICSAVVVLKRLLHADAPLALLKRVLKLIESVKAATARACVIWLVETHSDKPEIGNLAPDLLRKLAKSFCDEADCVKLQTLNLAVRLWIRDRAKCELLIRYVFQLARYDRSYDIRDRCRFLRNFLFNTTSGNGGRLPLEIFLCAKPAPSVQSQFSDRERFQLGTLSHLLNQKCANYTELPDFPAEAPDPTIRRSAHPLGAEEEKAIANQKKAAAEVLSEEEDDDDEEEEDDEDEEEDEEDEETEVSSNEAVEAKEDVTTEDDSVDEEEDEEEEDEDESTDEDEQDGDEVSPPPTITNSKYVHQTPTSKTLSRNEKQPESPITKPKKISNIKTSSANKSTKSEPTNLVDLLVDVDFNSSALSNASGTIAIGGGGGASKFQRGTAPFVSDTFFRLLSPMNTGGLSVEGRFTRSPSAVNASMVTVELCIWYRNPKVTEANVSITNKEDSELRTSGPLSVSGLKEDERRSLSLSVDFGDSSRASQWSLTWNYANEQRFGFEISAPFGEQVEALDNISVAQFELHRAQLAGMHQFSESIQIAPRKPKDVYRIVNCKRVDGVEWCFVAQTISRKDIVLISFCGLQESSKDPPRVTVHCENVTFGVLLCKEIQKAFSED